MSTLFKLKSTRYLRQEATDGEKILWDFFRAKKLGVKIRRQHPIDNFVIDFYIPSIKLAVEIDGAPHKTEFGKEYDQARDKYLKSKGIEMVRFWNSDAEHNPIKIVNEIEQKIKEKQLDPLQ